MHRPAAPHRGHRFQGALRRRAVAAAAAATLLALPGLHAVAQPYYSVSGSVGGFPGNPFIGFDPNQSLFNAGGNVLQVGIGAAGSFSMLAGAHLIASGLFYGDVLGNGSGTISGPGTVAELTGTGNRLQLGNWGTGALTVSGGALLDAAGNANACLAPGASCASVIGHAAGSTASLTVTGIGSELRTLSPLAIANADAYNPANEGYTFGTPGADTHASVNVLAGATLRSDGAYVSNGPVGAAATGTERTFADVVIDGIGSQWIVSPDRLTGGAANFNASGHANATSTITVGHGGRLAVDGSSGGVGANMWLGNGGQATMTIASGGKVEVGGATGQNASQLRIGQGSGSNGQVTVTGAGSELVVSGTHARLSVGTAGGALGGTGHLDVLAGGQVRAGNLYIADQGGTGVVNVNAASILLDGTDGRLLVGDTGNGTLLVSNGGLVDATLSPANCLGNWCGNIIANHAGSTALLTIAGAGSELRTLRGFTTANLYVDQFNGIPGGTSNATVNILAGGSLLSENTSLSSGTGGPNALGTEKSFTNVLIDGIGSRWTVVPDRFVAGSSAYLSAADHANAQATIEIRNGGQLLVDSSATGTGATFNLGNGGQATLNIASGGKLSIGGAADPNSSNLNIGAAAGGSAVVTVDGAGSQIVVSGSHAAIGVGNAFNAAGGSLSVTNGALVRTGGLIIGGSGSIGSVDVVGGTVELVGSDSRLFVGLGGDGTLTVRGGGVVDGTLNAANCVGKFCGSWVGYSVGSSGNLIVDGAGSELRLLQGFNAGNPFVSALTTGGGGVDASITVTGGGVLRTEGAALGYGPGGPNATGTEQSWVSALIDGPGSKWIVTRNSVDNASAVGMSLSVHANATTDVTVSNGGLLRIDGSGGAGPNSGISIGGSGTGTLVITGAGSKLETAGLGAYINVGAGNATSDGSLQVLAGGNATSLFMNVGRNGGSGELVIDGLGSLLTLSGVNTDAGSPGAASAQIGRNGGIGSMTVKNGGRFLITDGGMDSRPVNGSPGLTVGREANGTGSLTITGAGSTVEIVTTSLGLPEGTPDNFNPFMAVGRGAETAAGTLLVSNGGKLIMTGNAVSTPADARGTSLNIGGRNGEVGTGTATVTGAGSEIIVQGYDAYIGVGRTAGSSGTLHVLNQGKVSSTSLLVGADALGTVNLNNGRIALSGHRTDSSAVGAGGTIGRGAGGVGILSLANGSSLTIDADVITGGMSVGGDQFLAGGTGTVTLSGGSSIVMGGPLAGGSILVGRSGTGTMSLSGASLVDVGDTRTFSVATEAGGSGSLSVTGASTLRGNQIHIGGASDDVAGGLGTATVSGPGSEIRAEGASGFLAVGRGGIGTLTLANQGKLAATVMAVGRAAGGSGTLTLNNSIIELSGQQTSGSLSGARLSVGHRGGSGSANIGNNSLVTISNLGTDGASLYVGGNPLNALGSGTLTVSGGSQIRLVAAPGLAKVVIGHDGQGTATFSGASLLDAGDGNVIIAGEPGSTGTLVLNSGSVLNAGYVGVGSKPGGIDGGIGTLVVNASTVNATTLEIGSFSLLAGNGGQINAAIINRGTIGPGNSPGRLIVDGSVRVIDQGKLVLDVQDNGSGGYNVDELVLVKGSTYDFGPVAVTFHFIGATDPNAFAATGALDLDTFLRVKDGNNESGLSADFSGGATWNSLFAQASFNATSSAYDVISLDLKPDASGGFGIVAVPVPEPATWLLWLAGVLAIGARARRRGAARTG